MSHHIVHFPFSLLLSPWNALSFDIFIPRSFHFLSCVSGHSHLPIHAPFSVDPLNVRVSINASPLYFTFYVLSYGRSATLITKITLGKFMTLISISLGQIFYSIYLIILWILSLGCPIGLSNAAALRWNYKSSVHAIPNMFSASDSSLVVLISVHAPPSSHSSQQPRKPSCFSVLWRINCQTPSNMFVLLFYNFLFCLG